MVRLAEARDKWNVPELWLIISDEEDLDRIEKLLGPKLSGSFSRIKKYVKVAAARDIIKLYHNLVSHEGLLRELSKRG
ncbi:MAG: hypothetical protein RMH84_06575 [Sulfolobales archaeon]|nr:hypothetical protein [Sulfolobales archaeon]